MKKLSQKQIIAKYLEANPSTWFKSYELRGRATPYGFAGHQADRRAREMAEAGQIEVRHVGKYAEYRAKQVEPICIKRPMTLKEAIRQSQVSFNF